MVNNTHCGAVAQSGQRLGQGRIERVHDTATPAIVHQYYPGMRKAILVMVGLSVNKERQSAIIFEQ